MSESVRVSCDQHSLYKACKTLDPVNEKRFRIRTVEIGVLPQSTYQRGGQIFRQNFQQPAALVSRFQVVERSLPCGLVLLLFHTNVVEGGNGEEQNSNPHQSNHGLRQAKRRIDCISCWRRDY